MAQYVIGDVQGCYKDLKKLLKEINFNKDNDKLIFCGDVVNRGGQSLRVLRWIKSHEKQCKIVLGNHDLALLSQYYVPKFRKKTNLEFNEIFAAHDCRVLMHWLLSQSLLIHKKKHKKVIVHAGIYPTWDLKLAKKEALKAEKQIQKQPEVFFAKMYGSKPNHWPKKGHKSLETFERFRFVVNSLTRMRYLYKNGGMNFKAKGSLDKFEQLVPWFEFNKKKLIKQQIIFGHWSSLGLCKRFNVICLDSGKVWGGKLSALKLKKHIKIKKHITQV